MMRALFTILDETGGHTCYFVELHGLGQLHDWLAIALDASPGTMVDKLAGVAKFEKVARDDGLRRSNVWLAMQTTDDDSIECLFTIRDNPVSDGEDQRRGFMVPKFFGSLGTLLQECQSLR